jgi:hypothetical protein
LSHSPDEGEKNALLIEDLCSGRIVLGYFSGRSSSHLPDNRLQWTILGEQLQHKYMGKLGRQRVLRKLELFGSRRPSPALDSKHWLASAVVRVARRHHRSWTLLILPFAR